jgi:serine/threonine-protein kinase
VAGRNTQIEQLEEGRVFEGKYRIVDELGRGAFGEVYLAHQEAMDRSVALKVLQTQLTAQQAAKAKERFLREVRVISKLRHPNTITIHDFGETDQGVLYMVLEFIEGETLDDVLAREGAQPPERALHFTMQIARSLAEAHRHGVVHRDLKPANIMITRLETEGDFVKVLDFGVARLLTPDQQQDLTQAGVPDDEHQMLGTPRYMSPEQIRNKEIDGRSDVYCLGLLLYEMLVGQPAVQGDTAMALLTQHINPEPLPMEQLRTFPDAIAKIVRKCTAKDQDERYESAETLVADLRRVSSKLAQNAPSDASASGSDAFGAAGMSYEGELMTDPQSEMQNLDHGAEAPADGVDPSAAEHGAPPEEFGEADPFSSTRPKSEHADDLPPPPDDDDDAFGPEGAGRRDDMRATDSPGPSREGVSQQRQRETLMSFAGDIFKITLVTALGAFSIYISFLLIGAMFARLGGQFEIGGTVRIILSAVLALALPTLTAIGEVANRGQRGVVRRASSRITRVMIATMVMSFATGVLVTLVMPKTVIGEMRTNPNWFLSSTEDSSSISSLNADFSRRFADIIAKTTAGIGLYEPGAAEGRRYDRPARPTPDPIDDEPTSPPPSTRPSSDSDDNPDDSMPAPSAESESDSDGDGSDSQQPRSALELMDEESSEDDGDEGENQEKKKPNADDSASGSDSEGSDQTYKQW